MVFTKSDNPSQQPFSPAEVDDMEPLVDSAYQQLFRKLPADYLGRKPLSAYKRQYVAIINGKGQKEVWIGFFCDEPETGGKPRIHGRGRRACYLRITINLTLRKASELMANGVA